MEKNTKVTKTARGIVIAVSTQWWMKVNSNSIRVHGWDGARYPHILTVKYSVNGIEYKKRKWVHAGRPVPQVGDAVRVAYWEGKPAKANILT